MRLQPIVYVTDMAVSVQWYSQLLGSAPTVTSDEWTSFAVGGSALALHLADEPPRTGSVELSLISGDESLEVIAQRVTPVRAITHEPFGRSLWVADPDGTIIQINEHDPDRSS